VNVNPLDRKLDSADIKEFLGSVRLPFDNQESAMRYHFIHSQRYAITLNALCNIPLPKGMKVLELAASPYGMSAYLCRIFGEDLTLANFADPPVERTVSIGIDKYTYNLHEYAFNLEQDAWPFRHESFDLVIACEIVEHLAMDPMALFAGANRALRPGGRFFVSTPNSASIQNILKLGRLLPAGLAQSFRRPMSIARIYERHNREYTPFTIGEMFKASGFEVEFMGTDSAFTVDELGFSETEVKTIIAIIGIPELRCDTINVIGRKLGGVVERYPKVHELYLADDD
jgi:SAM-dependent methyltransferase